MLTPKHKSRTAQRLRSLLRELWSKSPYREQALKKARQPTKPATYLCAKCGEKFGLGEVEVDHIKELPTNNYTDINAIDWNAYVAGLFCPDTNLQVLCKRCHAVKTADYSLSRTLGTNLL